MRLNTLKPAAGSKQYAKRVGRGIGSGLGKTCGRGHKGQRARAGGFHRIGFEGGQMPFQRRVGKFGFNSALALITAEIRLDKLAKVESDVIDLAELRKANLINTSVKRVKIISSGEFNKKVNLKGIRVTQAARAAIEAAGGKIED